jgi:hypothetical protein
MSANTEAQSSFDKIFSKTLNWFSLIILLICFGSLVAIISYLTLHEVKPIKNEVNIVTSISNNDTLVKSKIKINDYLKKIEVRITDLQNVESNLDEKINEINDFYKFLGTILAIIIAITGFFGFKSLHELKIRNLENSKEVAKNAANELTEKEIQNIREKLISAISDAKYDAKLTMMSELNENQNKIIALEGNYKDLKNQLNITDKLENQFNDIIIRLKDLERLSVSGIKVISDVEESKISEIYLVDDEDDSLEEKDEFENKK